jgi:hypothetical protein
MEFRSGDMVTGLLDKAQFGSYGLVHSVQVWLNVALPTFRGQYCVLQRCHEVRICFQQFLMRRWHRRHPYDTCRMLRRNCMAMWWLGACSVASHGCLHTSCRQDRSGGPVVVSVQQRLVVMHAIEDEVIAHRYCGLMCPYRAMASPAASMM